MSEQDPTQSEQPDYDTVNPDEQDALRAEWSRRMDEAEVDMAAEKRRTGEPYATLDETGKVVIVSELTPNAARVIADRLMAEIGMDAHARHVWWSTPSGWLDGTVPRELVEQDPGRVLDACRAKLSNAVRER